MSPDARSPPPRNAAERIFLRKVGGGYIFAYRLLKDYFAELWEREYAGANEAESATIRR